MGIVTGTDGAATFVYRFLKRCGQFFKRIHTVENIVTIEAIFGIESIVVLAWSCILLTNHWIVHHLVLVFSDIAVFVLKRDVKHQLTCSHAHLVLGCFTSSVK